MLNIMIAVVRNTYSQDIISNVSQHENVLVDVCSLGYGLDSLYFSPSLNHNFPDTASESVPASAALLRLTAKDLLSEKLYYHNKDNC